MAVMRKARKSWDEYFLDIATAVAQRGTCLEVQAGCVIVDKHNRIVSTGYNGSSRDRPHCIDVGCNVKSDHCIRTVHAEENAIVEAYKLGVKSYSTHKPCSKCEIMLRGKGIQIIWRR
jgi:dCMP deaminase